MLERSGNFELNSWSRTRVLSLVVVDRECGARSSRGSESTIPQCESSHQADSRTTNWTRAAINESESWFRGLRS